MVLPGTPQPQQAQSLTGSLKQGLQNVSNKAKSVAASAMTSVATEMSLPMIKKFRQDLAKAMSNKREFEKRPMEERQAIFNEVKQISKLLHLEGVRANFARNFGMSGGMHHGIHHNSHSYGMQGKSFTSHGSVPGRMSAGKKTKKVKKGKKGKTAKKGKKH